MKNILVLVSGVSLLLVITSCGGDVQKSDLQNTASPSDLMAEAPTYDPKKIDPNAPIVEIQLKAVGNTMADIHYDDTLLEVKAGTTVRLLFINTSQDETMLHNFTLIEEGTADKVAMEGVKSGPDKDYIPALKEVLLATKMLKPNETVEIAFPAPAVGMYDFICTYPGHALRMRGKFKVN